MAMVPDAQVTVTGLPARAWDSLRNLALLTPAEFSYMVADTVEAVVNDPAGVASRRSSAPPRGTRAPQVAQSSLQR